MLTHLRNRNFTTSTILILVGVGTIITAAIDFTSRANFTDKNYVVYALAIMVTLALLLKAWDAWPSDSIQLSTRYSRDIDWRKTISLLGGINVVAYAFYTIMTYGMAPLAPFDSTSSLRLEHARKLADALGFLGVEAQSFILGENVFAQREIWLLAYLIPLLISTVIFIVLLVMLARYRQSLTNETPRFLMKWAGAFALIMVFALPILVMDFWHPLAWGRMVLAGINPYYTPMTTEFAQNLPIHLGDKMMYGPLWAIGYGVLMGIAGERVWLAAFLFKVLFAGAWIGSLRMIMDLLEKQGAWYQCVGILIIGWLPIGLHQGVAEGHNDVLMIFFLLLWIYLIEKGREGNASLSLMASMLIKYVSAPLFLLDFLQSKFAHGQSLRKYLIQLIAPAILLGISFALFYRSPEFFGYFKMSDSWNFHSPKEAVIGLLWLANIRFTYTGRVVRIFFILVSMYHVVRYLQRPEPTQLRKTLLAVMVGMLFGVSSHVWPWYLLWVLAPAALIPDSTLTRGVIGVALLMPIPILVWTLYVDLGEYYVFWAPEVLVYTGALLWLILMPRRWLQTPHLRRVSTR